MTRPATFRCWLAAICWFVVATVVTQWQVRRLYSKRKFTHATFTIQPPYKQTGRLINCKWSRLNENLHDYRNDRY